MTEPWGHKLTIHVYIEGDMERALELSNAYASFDPPIEPAFVGIDIREIGERPYSQGESRPLSPEEFEELFGDLPEDGEG